MVELKIRRLAADNEETWEVSVATDEASSLVSSVNEGLVLKSFCALSHLFDHPQVDVHSFSRYSVINLLVEVYV